MATKHFAMPLNGDSLQTGDTTVKALWERNAAVQLRLTNVSAGESNKVTLITQKNGQTTRKEFVLKIEGGVASVELSPHDLGMVFDDAMDGDWDFVEAEWTVGATDFPNGSLMYEVQSGRTTNLHGWPPNK
ncbi:MAG TPA: hypothetical protein VGL38_14030 [bacterium]|jgi:hypothetical protein